MKRAIRLAVISMVGRTPGFLIPVIIGSLFGAGPDTDAYFLVYGAVLLTAGTLAQGVESAIVHFSASHTGSDPTAAPHFEDRVVWPVLAGTLGIWLVAVPLVVIAAPHTLEGRILGFALLLSPMALVWPAGSVYSGGLIARWQIAEASISFLWRGAGALLGIAGALLGGGLFMVAAGLSVGEIVRVLWLRSRLWRAHDGNSSDASPLSPRLFLGAAGAQVLAAGIGASPPFVERLLATTLGAGGVSRLEYAARLLVIPAVLFEGGLAPLHLAQWSNEIAQGRPPASGLVLRAVGKGVALAALIAVLIATLAPTVVDLLLGHGRMGPDDIQAVGHLLRLLAVGFVATMGALLVERLYLAQARNRTLAFLAIGRAAVRLGIVVTLLPGSGLTAFAIGYAAAEWAYFLALIAMLFRGGVPRSV